MIDEEIRQTLDVDPSPEFLARVRSRIAREPAPAIWRASWRLVAAGTIAAGIVISVVVSRLAPAAATRPAAVQLIPVGTNAAEPPGSGSASPLAVPPPGLKLHALRQGQGEARSAKAGSRTVTMAAPSGLDADVLLDSRETRALRQLISGVREGRIDLAAAQRATSPTLADPEPLADIIIAPITIEPLAPQSGAEGARP